MTNFEIIKRYLEFGFKVKCQLVDKSIIFSSLNGECIRGSYEYAHFEDCYAGLGEESYNEHYINDHKMKLTPIIEKPKMYEVGDLVDIAEEAREIEGFDSWDKSVKDLVGKKGLKVTGCVSDAADVCCSINIYWFPLWAVTPHIPEQNDEVAKAIKVLEKAGKIVDGKIINL